MLKTSALAAFVAISLAPGTSPSADLKVGVSAVALEADDSMVIAGGIHPRFVKGQEGELRATAIVMERPQEAKLAIVSVDVLMITRDLIDPVVDEIERECGIPAANIMVHSTHTHHAPSTMRVHGYDRDEVFCRRVQRGDRQGGGRGKLPLDRRRIPFQAGRREDGGPKQPDIAGRRQYLLDRRARRCGPPHRAV